MQRMRGTGQQRAARKQLRSVAISPLTGGSNDICSTWSSLFLISRGAAKMQNHSLLELDVQLGRACLATALLCPSQSSQTRRPKTAEHNWLAEDNNPLSGTRRRFSRRFVRFHLVGRTWRPTSLRVDMASPRCWDPQVLVNLQASIWWNLPGYSMRLIMSFFLKF